MRDESESVHFAHARRHLFTWRSPSMVLVLPYSVLFWFGFKQIVNVLARSGVHSEAYYMYLNLYWTNIGSKKELAGPITVQCRFKFK